MKTGEWPRGCSLFWFLSNFGMDTSNLLGFTSESGCNTSDFKAYTSKPPTYAQVKGEYAQLAPLYAQLHCRYAQLSKSTKKQPSQKGQLSSAFLFDFSKAWYRKAKTFSNTSPEFRIRFVQVADLAKFDIFFCDRA